MTNKKYLMLTVVGAVVFGIASASQASFVLFSSFETPIIPDNTSNGGATGPGYQNFAPGSTIDGWLVGPGDVDIINYPPSLYSPSPFPDGNQAVDLNGFNPGSISQSIPTSIGQTYAMEFWLSQNGVSDPTAKTTAQAGGVSQDFESDSSQWRHFELDFTATSTSTLLSFSSVAPPGASGPTLDLVTVTAVPLPASVGVGFSMLGGFGLMFAARKQLNRRARIA